MLALMFTTKFKKDFKRIQKQGKNMAKLHDALELLQHETPLPESMHDHMLSGSYNNHRECHIEPDWLLIYRIDKNELILTAVRTGSHSDLLNI